MREPFDETRLTAYALGELPEAEQREIEARLEGAPELRREVEAIRQAAAALRMALAPPPAEALAPAQRASILAEAAWQAARARRASGRPWLPVAALSGIAAALLIGLVSWRLLGRKAAAPPKSAPAPAFTFSEAPSLGPTAAPPPRVGDAVSVSATAAPPPTTAAVAIAERNAPSAGSPQMQTGVREGRITAEPGDAFSHLGSPPPGEALRPQPGGVSKESADRLRALGYLGPDVEPFDPQAQLRQPSAEFNTSAYDHIRDNPFVRVAQDPRSTFSIDVDTASYAIVRSFLKRRSLPPRDAVRIEELVNYFEYDDAPPRGRQPFAVHLAVAGCPWQPQHRLVRIALRGKELDAGQRPPANLVFLLDVSGSMARPNKLPLVKQALRLLLNQLQPFDSVAIVVYAGAEGLALPPTPVQFRDKVLAAIDTLSPGGTTHGSAGLRLAYEVAQARFIPGGVNRIILATDGDFNVGVTNQAELVRLIEEKAKGGVFLTALGFGMDNLKDSTLEKLADHGNGHYAYIDTLSEARKVLVRQASSTLVTIAKDVKLQLEFNPAAVQAFRLIGYENRVLAHQDFNDDRKDAGEIGAGHAVTAFYEVVPPGVPFDLPAVDPLRYQPALPPPARPSDELLTLKLRYKEPEGSRSQLMEVVLRDHGLPFETQSADFRFAAAVAAFGMVLRDSPYKGSATLSDAREWAQTAIVRDEGGLRREFLQLVDAAQRLPPRE